ncbi:MAG: hypothetical protein ABI647_20190 [Gemmatimonadota bacterium]
MLTETVLSIVAALSVAQPSGWTSGDPRGTEQGRSITAEVGSVPRVATDSLVVHNTMPHPMRVFLILDQTEKEIGLVDGLDDATLEITVPESVREIRLRASDPHDVGMEARITLTREPGKVLRWNI